MDIVTKVVLGAVAVAFVVAAIVSAVPMVEMSAVDVLRWMFETATGVFQGAF